MEIKNQGVDQEVLAEIRPVIDEVWAWAQTRGPGMWAPIFDPEKGYITVGHTGKEVEIEICQMGVMYDTTCQSGRTKYPTEFVYATAYVDDVTGKVTRV